MDTHLDITFHNMAPLADVERCIRKRAERLERLYDRMVALRVAVETPHRQHRAGNLCGVHIAMTVPGEELVVSRPPHHAKPHQVGPDALASVRDAFEAAERRLKTYKDRRR